MRIRARSESPLLPTSFMPSMPRAAQPSAKGAVCGVGALCAVRCVNARDVDIGCGMTIHAHGARPYPEAHTCPTLSQLLVQNSSKEMNPSRLASKSLRKVSNWQRDGKGGGPTAKAGIDPELHDRRGARAGRS